jgi:PKD repeat protein
MAFNTFTFKAIAYDPGADDITFYWDFGDGTNISNFYPNQNQIYPVNITDRVSHTFSGTGKYTVTLIVSDDDGGKTSVSITIDVG